MVPYAAANAALAAESKMQRPTGPNETAMSNQIDNEAEQLSRLCRAAERVEDIVLRLVGPEPKEAGHAKPDAAPCGLLPRMGVIHEDRNIQIRRLHDALDRIEALV